MRIDYHKPLVAIHCLVYNHEPYLRDCLEGFVMQQTNFPFVAIVHDDASIDGSAEIIREYEEKYPHIFKPIFETENQYSKRDGALERIMDDAINATGAKYVAMCEGDDYWTDPLKLQKQVDFMEANPEYSMCFHGAEIKNETDTKVITTCQNIDDKEYFTNDIFPGWVVPTASVVYRRLMVNSYPKLSNTKWMYYGDIVLFLKCTHTGRVWGMKEKMSIYRMTYTGAVISAQYDPKVIEKQCNHYRFLMMNFPQLDKKWPSEYIAKYHYTMFRQTKGVLNKLKSLCVAVRFSPQIVWQKLTSAFKRI
jgi:glycosyltransferase involved in cell wall biosynthesis